MTIAGGKKRTIHAILFADVTNYMGLMHRQEEVTHARIIRLIELVSQLCHEYDGNILEQRQDGLFVLFQNATDALHCANRAQLQIESQPMQNDGDSIHFGMGLHLGEVVNENGQYYGDSINIAARLQNIAEPGGICVSDAVYQATQNISHYYYRNLGTQYLKNIEKPVDVFQIQRNNKSEVSFMLPSIDHLPPSLTGYNQPSLRTSIAVLPFRNTNNDRQFDYFSDGVTEDLITSLSRFRNLFVMSRCSSFIYRGRNVTPTQVGLEMGVHYLVEGSVAKIGNRVRIYAQLTNAKTHQTLWADQYDRKLDDIFEVQDEITAIICNATSITITDEENKKLSRLTPTTFNSYNALLKGRPYSYLATKESNYAARRMYELATDIDPDYAHAHAAIAKTLNAEWLFLWNNNPDNTIQRAMNSAQKAVELDEFDARAHASIGFVALYQKQHDESISAYQHALQLNPNDADIIAEMADAYTHTGDSEKAIGLFNKAINLNPFQRDRYLWDMGGAYFNLKQYEKAVDTILQMKDTTGGCRILAASYAYMNQLEKAKQYAEKAVKVQPNFSLPLWKERIPDKYPSDTEHFIDGLRKAGLH